MSDVIPNIFLIVQAAKKVDFVNDEMKMVFLSGTYDECFVRDAQSFSDISQYEVSGLSYPAGGVPVTGQTITINDDLNELVYDVDDIYMSVSGGPFGPTRYGAIYNISNDDHLVYVFDFGEDKTVNDGAEFKIKIDDAGLMKAKQM